MSTGRREFQKLPSHDRTTLPAPDLSTPDLSTSAVEVAVYSDYRINKGHEKIHSSSDHTSVASSSSHSSVRNVVEANLRRTGTEGEVNLAKFDISSPRADEAKQRVRYL